MPGRLAILTLGVATAAQADVALRAGGAAAFALSEPQRSYFGLGGAGHVSLQLELASVLDVQLALGGLGLSASPGAPVSGPTSVLLAGGGLRLKGPRHWARVNPWLDAELHYVNTGGLSRLALAVGAGVSFAPVANGPFAMGPHLRFIEVFKLVDEPGFTSRDAALLTAGLTIELWLTRSPGDRDGDQLNDSVDGCPDEPGPPPSGCPLRDGDGDGIADAADHCPNQAGLSGFAGCPDPDPDRDQVLSPSDACPNQPEDRDGFRDDDGCPEPDNDGDGVMDADDDCPVVAGAALTRGCPDSDGDGVADALDECPRVKGVSAQRGCPEYKQVVVTPTRLELNQKIFFAFGKDKILPKSFALLDEVTQALKDHERLCVRIEGHTDAVGSAAKNLKLSGDRARSVLAYLARQGVAAARLAAKGYGPEHPLETNKTPEGRERNRRVEFVIVACERGPASQD